MANHIAVDNHTRDSISSLSSSDRLEASSSKQDVDSTNDSDAEQEELEDVDDLLYLAQIDLIEKHYHLAIPRLEAAVQQGSSLAATTLANLLVRGLNLPQHPPTSTDDHSSHSHPPMSPPVPSGRTAPRRNDSTPLPSREDRQRATAIFLKGLEFELLKPVHRRSAHNGNDKSTTARVGHDDEGSSDSDDEDAEGKTFSVQRISELIQGLCDQYRHGGLDQYEPSHKLESTEHAESVVRDLLLHPSLTNSSIRLILPTLDPLPSPLPPPERPSPFDSPATQTSVPVAPALRRLAPTRSQTAPPSRSMRGIVHLTKEGKVKVNAQVHLLYTLALLVWPTQQNLAESLWNEALDIAGSVGGSLGSREADDIVAKAAHRLNHNIDHSWKMAKGKRRADTLAAAATTRAMPTSSSLPPATIVQSPSSGAAPLLEEPTLSTSPTSTNNITTSYFEPSATTSTPAFVPVSPPKVPLPVPSSSSNGRGLSTSSASTIRAAKFHVGGGQYPTNTTDYPSPPPTPESTLAHSLDDDEEEDKTVTLPRSMKEADLPLERSTTTKKDQQHAQRPSHRRSNSSASFSQPSLMRRVESRSSIATLPNYFGRAPKSSWGAGGEGQKVEVRDQASRLVEMLPNEAEGTRTWSTGFRRTLEGLKSSVIGRAGGGKKGTTASSLLRQVLTKEEEKVEVVYVWGDEEEEEGHEYEFREGEREELEAKRKGKGKAATTGMAAGRKPRISRNRSFQDPTSSYDRTTAGPSGHNSHSTSPATSSPPSPSIAIVSSPTNGDSSSHDNSGDNTKPTTSSNNLAIPRLVHTPATPESTSPTPLSISASSLSRRNLSSNNHERRLRASTIVLSSSIPHISNLAPVDPFLADLEKRSRVAIKSVCACCGKKGRNFPKTRKGKTFCSRECRELGVDRNGNGSASASGETVEV